MKKILIFAVILSFLVPAAAFAATEFALGGYIKLDSWWDSTQNGAYMNGPAPRNNDPNNHHGNFRMTAMGSRFNFTIKGPDVLGAKLTGFLEMDFEESANDTLSQSNIYVPRLRHAMFRLNWPGDTELLFGQYWSMFCDYYIESTEDGPFMVVGTPTARLPQIRFTQGFAQDWKVAAMVASPNALEASNGTQTPYNASTNAGEDSETPQLQGQVKYSHDWWGKAAFFGHPMPFTASVTAGWQRDVARFTGIPAGGQGLLALTNISGGATANGNMANTYLNPWLVMGSLFIPVIPTHSDNLAGTMHIILQPWVGQDVYAFGFFGDTTNVFKYNNNTFGGSRLQFNQEELKRWGGMVEAQYYFDNQWYLNVAYGKSAVMGIGSGWQNYFVNSATAAGVQMRSQQQIDTTLWWRPIAALKFGLQYSYVHTNYLYDASAATTFPVPGTAQGAFTNKGDEHRVEFAGYFYF